MGRLCAFREDGDKGREGGRACVSAQPMDSCPPARMLSIPRNPPLTLSRGLCSRLFYLITVNY